MNEYVKSANHGIIVENRNKMSITGVSDVKSFDDQTIVLVTSMGELTVKGEELNINHFTNDTGDLSVEGKIHALGYTKTDGRKGVFNRLFG